MLFGLSWLLFLYFNLPKTRHSAVSHWLDYPSALPRFLARVIIVITLSYLYLHVYTRKRSAS